MHLIHAVVENPDLRLLEIAVRVDRHTLAKRLWRGRAEDGVELGFELAAPLRHGDNVHQTAHARYVIRQEPESLVEISLECAASAAAGIGWAIGNLHLELSAEPTRLLTPDEPAVRQLLARLEVPYQTTTAVFRPGRFARGSQRPQELGAANKH
jgi:urease accessory protein